MSVELGVPLRSVRRNILSSRADGPFDSARAFGPPVGGFALGTLAIETCFVLSFAVFVIVLD